MQRTATWILAAVVGFVLAALAGSYVTGRLAPEGLRLETEERLSEALGTSVRIASLRPVFHRGLALELRGVNTGAEPEAAGLRAEHALLALDLRGLLFGGAPLRALSLRGAELVLERDSEGGWQPPGVARLLGLAAASPEAAREGGEALLERLGDALRLVLNTPVSLPSLDLEAGRVVVRIESGPGSGAAPLELAFEDLYVELDRRLFGRGVQLEARGRVRHPGGSEGSFEARGRLSNAERLELHLALEDLDLEPARVLLARWLPGLTLSGRLGGSVDWEFHGPGVHELAADLALESLAATLPRRVRADPLSLNVPAVKLSFEAEARPEALTVSDIHLVGQGSEVRIGGRWELARGSRAEGFVALRAWELPLPPVRDALIALLPNDAAWLEGILGGVQAGRIVSLLLSFPREILTHAGPGASAEADVWPDTLRGEAELADVAVLLAGGRRLSGLGGTVRVSPAELELHEIRARLDDRPLPRLNLSLTGLRQWQSWRKTSPPHGPGALPGLVPLYEWLAGALEKGRPGWSRLGLEIAWLSHPALLRRLEGVRLEVERGSEEIRGRLARAVWGGVELRGRGSLTPGSPGALALELEARPGVSNGLGPGDHPVENVWLRGRVHADLERVGPFASRALATRVAAWGAELALEDAEILLWPRGRARGAVRLDLARPDEVPYRASLQLEDGSLEHLLADLRVRDAGLEGDVVAAGRLHGALRPGTKLIARLSGPLSVHARNGTIRRRLPVVVALAKASDTLNPLASRDVTPYRAIDAELELSSGRLEARQLSVDAPALRLVSTGSVELLDPEHTLEAVVGLFFFRKLDAMIDKVPVLNRLLLGSDENLVAAYFALSGPWKQPEARFIPTKSLAAGPGSVVVVGLPAFVRGGVERLQALLGAGARAATGAPSPGAKGEPQGGSAAPPPPGPEGSP